MTARAGCAWTTAVDAVQEASLGFMPVFSPAAPAGPGSYSLTVIATSALRIDLLLHVHAPVTGIGQHAAEIFNSKCIAVSHGGREDSSRFAGSTCIRFCPGDGHWGLIRYRRIGRSPSDQRLSEQKGFTVAFSVSLIP